MRFGDSDLGFEGLGCKVRARDYGFRVMGSGITGIGFQLGIEECVYYKNTIYCILYTVYYIRYTIYYVGM